MLSAATGPCYQARHLRRAITPAPMRPRRAGAPAEPPATEPVHASLGAGVCFVGVEGAGLGVAGVEGAGVAGVEGAGVAGTEGAGVAGVEGAGVAGTEGAGVAVTEGVGADVAGVEGAGVALTEGVGAGVAGVEGAGVEGVEGAGAGVEGVELGSGVGLFVTLGITMSVFAPTARASAGLLGSTVRAAASKPRIVWPGTISYPSGNAGSAVTAARDGSF